MPRLEPLDLEDCPEESRRALELAQERLGFIPNSLRILARKPKILEAFSNMAHAAWAPGSVEPYLKGLVAHITSRSAGCVYCSAHTTGMAIERGSEAGKIEHIWEYETSDLFSDAERAALRVAQGAALAPNAVTDEDFAELKKHWTGEQIVEILAIISVFGFLNRWNDTLATPLEDGPRDLGEKHLSGWGWEAGKHAAE